MIFWFILYGLVRSKSIMGVMHWALRPGDTNCGGTSALSRIIKHWQRNGTRRLLKHCPGLTRIVKTAFTWLICFYLLFYLGHFWVAFLPDTIKIRKMGKEGKQYHQLKKQLRKGHKNSMSTLYRPALNTVEINNNGRNQLDKQPILFNYLFGNRKIMCLLKVNNVSPWKGHFKGKKYSQALILFQEPLQ